MYLDMGISVRTCCLSGKAGALHQDPRMPYVRSEAESEVIRGILEDFFFEL